MLQKFTAALLCAAIIVMSCLSALASAAPVEQPVELPMVQTAAPEPAMAAEPAAEEPSSQTTQAFSSAGWEGVWVMDSYVMLILNGGSTVFNIDPEGNGFRVTVDEITATDIHGIMNDTNIDYYAQYDLYLDGDTFYFQHLYGSDQQLIPDSGLYTRSGDVYKAQEIYEKYNAAAAAGGTVSTSELLGSIVSATPVTPPTPTVPVTPTAPADPNLYSGGTDVWDGIWVKEDGSVTLILMYSGSLLYYIDANNQGAVINLGEPQNHGDVINAIVEDNVSYGSYDFYFYGDTMEFKHTYHRAEGGAVETGISGMYGRIAGDPYAAYETHSASGSIAPANPPAANPPAASIQETPAAGAAHNLGDYLGDVLYSDIIAYINGYPIPTSITNGRTMVVAEDLANYGFSVLWDAATWALYVMPNPGGVFTPLPVETNTMPVGAVKCPYVYTTIKTYLSGAVVESFAIDGRTLIDFELLAKYGTVVWDNTTRSISLTVN